MSKEYKIGIMSDSHDHLDNVKKIVKIFNQKELKMVFHLGDFNSNFIINELRNINCAFLGILGESEGDVPSLIKSCSENMKIVKEMYETQIQNKMILLIRNPALIESVSSSKKYDFIIYGQTHIMDLRKKNDTLIINPGEACGYITGKSQALVLEILSGDVEIINL